MISNEFKKEFKQLKTISDVEKYIAQLSKKSSTVFSLNYTDYERTEFYKRIKAYNLNGDYIIVVTQLENMHPNEIEIFLMDEIPQRPHPLFPLVSIYKNAKAHYVYKNK